MSQPKFEMDQEAFERELDAHDRELAHRWQRAEEFHTEDLYHAIWSNPRITELLYPHKFSYAPMPYDSLVERIRSESLYRTPPGPYGSWQWDSYDPPALDRFKPKTRNPSQTFYVSPGGGLALTLGEVSDLGRVYSDEGWIDYLVSCLPIWDARNMGKWGPPSCTLADFRVWLNKTMRWGHPDYTAACIDMYLAGAGIRRSLLTEGGYVARDELALYEAYLKSEEAKNRQSPVSAYSGADRERAPMAGGRTYQRKRTFVANAPAAKPDAAHSKLEAAQAEGRWNISQERADQLEAAKRAERAAANQEAYERGEVARVELPKGFDKSKITWSTTGPRGVDLGGDVLYGYDYQGRYIGNRINGIQDDSGSLFLVGGVANVGKVLAKAAIRRLVKRKLVSPITGGTAGAALSDAVAARAEAISIQGSPGYLSNSVRGPVLTGVLDTQTGEIFYGLNNGAVPENLHPLLQARLDTYLDATGGVTPLKAGIPGSHSEIMALSDALYAREAAAGIPVTESDLSSFLLSNRSLIGQTRVIGIPPRCPNCSAITSGVTVVGGD